MNDSPYKKRNAVTLTELLVSISIIGLLATLIFTGYRYAFNATERTGGEVQSALAQVARSEAEALKVTRPAHTSQTGLPSLNTSGDPKTRPAIKSKQMKLESVPQEYVIAFAPSVKDPAAEARRMAAQFGGQVLAVYTRIKAAAALRIPNRNYLAFRADPAIKSIDGNYRIYMRQQTVPTGVRRVFSYPALPPHQLVLRLTPTPNHDRNLNMTNKAIGNSKINIAIMDSGVDLKHPDLNVVHHMGVQGIPNGDDEDGHGTHCAGVAAAIDNGFGVVGVYPGAPIWSVRVFDSSGGGTLAGFLEACQFVYDNADKIKVCNLSFGPPVTVPIFDEFIDACVLNGVVMVGAAGNDAKLASSSSPGSAKYIVNVGALADSDGRPGKLGGATPSGPDDTFATFSDWDYKITVLAPGVNILSTSLGGGYSTTSGTSDAAPSVVGLVARLLDPKTSFGKNNRNLFQLSRPPANATQMAAYLRSIATETVPGIHGEPFVYPVVNFKVQ
jgi:subtilisin